MSDPTRSNLHPNHDLWQIFIRGLAEPLFYRVHRPLPEERDFGQLPACTHHRDAFIQAGGKPDDFVTCGQAVRTGDTLTLVYDTAGCTGEDGHPRVIAVLSYDTPDGQVRHCPVGTLDYDQCNAKPLKHWHRLQGQVVSVHTWPYSGHFSDSDDDTDTKDASSKDGDSKDAAAEDKPAKTGDRVAIVHVRRFSEQLGPAQAHMQRVRAQYPSGTRSAYNSPATAAFAAQFMPKIDESTTAESFFKALEQLARGLPVWERVKKLFEGDLDALLPPHPGFLAPPGTVVPEEVLRERSEVMESEYILPGHEADEDYFGWLNDDVDYVVEEMVRPGSAGDDN